MFLALTNSSGGEEAESFGLFAKESPTGRHYFEVSGTECSVWDFNGQWEPELTTPAVLWHRLTQGRLGWTDDHDAFNTALKAVVAPLNGPLASSNSATSVSPAYPTMDVEASPSSHDATLQAQPSRPTTGATLEACEPGDKAGDEADQDRLHILDGCFYKFDGLTLTPGSKSAGFTFQGHRDALRALNAPIADAQRQALMLTIEQRLRHAALLPPDALDYVRVTFEDGTAVPRAFVVDPMFGGSVGADPEELRRALNDDPRETWDLVDYTPHNLDQPSHALALMVMASTWAEWAGTLAR